MDSTRRWGALAIAIATGMIAAPAASAANETYPAADGERSLNSGPAGYEGFTDSEGPCVQLSLCPTVSNEYRPTGGVRNSGHLRTSISSLTGIEAVSIGRWTGPAFTYRGVAGAEPDDLRLRISRRSDVETLLAVEGNSATYSVDLLPTGGGAAVSAIDRATLAGLDDFVEKSERIDAASLTIGERYRIRITTRFESGGQVFPGASADYDDISLLAKQAAPAAGGPGGEGGPGGPGGTGANGNGGGKGGALTAGGKPSIVGAAVLQGSKLLVKVRCARKPKSRCKPQLQALLKKKGPRVTNKRVVRVPVGKKRRIALDVRRRHLDEVRSTRKVVLMARYKLVGKGERRSKKAKTITKRVKVRVKDA